MAPYKLLRMSVHLSHWALGILDNPSSIHTSGNLSRTSRRNDETVPQKPAPHSNPTMRANTTAFACARLCPQLHMLSRTRVRFHVAAFVCAVVSRLAVALALAFKLESVSMNVPLHLHAHPCLCLRLRSQGEVFDNTAHVACPPNTKPSTHAPASLDVSPRAQIASQPFKPLVS